MKTTIIFLRHADTEKNPNQNAKQWGLSANGREQAERFVDDPICDSIEVIYSSNESKSILTATPVADKLHIEILRDGGFNEVARGDTYLSDEDFALEKQRQLDDWDHPAQGGETGNQALDRFELSVRNIAQKHAGKVILVVSHGTILNLYFAKITNPKEQTFARWERTGFCSYGIVENGVVVKDIVM